MSARDLLQHHLDHCPLIAILRGVTAAEAVAIGEAVQEAGIGIIEVPLNSPEPLQSIERLAARFGEDVLVGAGTVLDRADVRRVADAGGRIIVSPDTNAEVIAAAAAAGMVSTPGYFTPSEGFAAIRAGATALKLFPAEAATPTVLEGAPGGLAEGHDGPRRGRHQARQYATVAGGRGQRVRPRRRALPARSIGCRDAGQGACLCRGRSAMKPIKIAIIGFGKIAADQHAPSILGNERFDLVATSSRSGQGLAQTYTDWRELIRSTPGLRGGSDHHAARPAFRNCPRMHRGRAPLPARKATNRWAGTDRRP